MRLRVELAEGVSEWESDMALFRIGRGDACALRFEGDAAKYSSWEHAEFLADGRGGVTITDLGSSNGTYVNGERIECPTKLSVGDTVRIGGKGPTLHVLELP
ncbi:MAG TPA: FHA domain-containing protein, partial [Pirellulales bacterium]